MENIVDIYNLLPEEINEAIKKLSDALEVVKNRKNTNSKFVDNEKLNNWRTASLRTLLNKGDYYNRSGSYENIGLSTTARSQIESVKWYLGGSREYQNLGGPDYYAFERGTSVYTGSTNIMQKVGLMYPIDYVYTYATGVSDKCYTDGYNCYTSGDGSSSEKAYTIE